MSRTFVEYGRPPDAAMFAARRRDRLSDVDKMLHVLERKQPPFDQPSFLEPLNEVLIAIRNVADEANLVSRVHPDSMMRNAAADVFRQTQRLRTKLLHNRRIYQALGTVIAQAVGDPLALRAATLTRQDMRRAGVELSGAERQEVDDLRDELVDLEQKFGRNIRDDVRKIELNEPAELDGLPPDYVAGRSPSGDGAIIISTTNPDYYPFMEYAHSERARLALLHEFYNRAVPANLQILRQILTLRHKLATALGYAHWADYATEDMMVGSARNVVAFLEQVDVLTGPGARKELAELLEFKRRGSPFSQTIGAWESFYYQQLVRTERHDFDARSLRQYFEYRAVRQAVLDLNAELFGLTFTPIVLEHVWHASVESFDVQMDGRPMGRISLDMHPRAGKQTQAASYTLRTGVAGVQLPHVVLVCNFSDPSEQAERALLDHREVVTFLHEFGHLVHAIVRSGQQWIRLAAPSERDFNEAPSQFLEEWMFDPRVLKRFTHHTIPQKLVDGLRASHDFGRALRARWLLFQAMVSLVLHASDPSGLDITNLVLELAQRFLPFELPVDTHFEASFEHLVWYSATVYTYLWSRAIARDLLSAFPNGLLDPAQMRRYRDLVLAPGGSKPAAELLRNFCGHPLTFAAF